jgi:hypothetical protein
MTFKNLVVIMLLAAGGYYVYENYLKAEPPPQSFEIPGDKRNDPIVKSNNVVCPECNKLGRLVDRSGTTSIGYRCPICDGLGSRPIPANLPACSECKGMGKVKIPEHIDRTRDLGSRIPKIRAQRCPLCQGSGIEKKAGL